MATCQCLGLQDEHDIKMLSHLILIKFARKHASTVLGRVEDIVEAMDKTLKVKPKSNAVKNEVFECHWLYFVE